ncbi:MAG: hypothetical protein Q9181_004913 [Wetmoreana brouardii]
MPKERKKRGRREEEKRKREDAENSSSSKRQKPTDEGEVEIITSNDQQADGAYYVPPSGPGGMPFYGLLDEEEQEYFKRADTVLELNQFKDAEERVLFLANVYKEANGKELKIANSQSCSRLMERLISLSTPDQLKALFRKFGGQFLHLTQHRFASHCCEALFVQAAPIVSAELKAATKAKSSTRAKEANAAEQLFLDTVKELEGNLGYLMVDRFASHTLRVLLLVLSGRSLENAQALSLLQSKRKETITLASKATQASDVKEKTRTVPDSFRVASVKMANDIVGGLDTTYLRALASHPVANPLLQLLLQLEFHHFGKAKAKDAKSLFRKLLPDDLPEQGTGSATFFNGMLYDPIGSRLLEVLVEISPGKTFKVLYHSLLRDRLVDLAKSEAASYVLIKALERLSKEDLEGAFHTLSPHVKLLLDRSRMSVISCLIDRCRVREVDSSPLHAALDPTAFLQPGPPSVERLKRILKLTTVSDENLSDGRRKHIEKADPGKVHASLLAQSMLEGSWPLRNIVVLGLVYMDAPSLLEMARDRSATYVLQKFLTQKYTLPDLSKESLMVDNQQKRELVEEHDKKKRNMEIATWKSHRIVMRRLFESVLELATDPVGSYVLDAFWIGSGRSRMNVHMRESVAERLYENEATLRDSSPGRSTWRKWKMDMYKTRRHEWKAEAKPDPLSPSTAIELARRRYHMGRKGSTTYQAYQAASQS